MNIRKTFHSLRFILCFLFILFLVISQDVKAQKNKIDYVKHLLKKLPIEINVDVEGNFNFNFTAEINSPAFKSKILIRKAELSDLEEVPEDYTLLIITKGDEIFEERFIIRASDKISVSTDEKDAIEKVIVEHKRVTIKLKREGNQTLYFRDMAAYATTSLNVRITPEPRKNNIMGVIDKNEVVEYLGVRSKYKIKNQYWYLIRLNDGRKGWVYGKYLKFDDIYGEFE